MSKPMLLQNLKEHAKIKHGTNHPKIKGQPTVSSMFLGGGKNKRKKGSEIVVASSSSNFESTLTDSIEVGDMSEDALDENRNQLISQEEGSDRKEIIAKVSEDFDKGVLTQDCLDRLSNFELLFLMKEKSSNVKQLERKELLKLVCSLYI